MPYKKITFEGATGNKIAGRLDFPLNSQPQAYALFAHCFTCTQNLKAIAHITRALANEGIAVLRFDFTGLGESEGDFADTNFSSNVQDLVAAADFLETAYESPKILIGHSLGGAAVLQAAAKISSALAVVTIAAPSEPGHAKHLFGSELETIRTTGEAKVTLAGRSFQIKKQFIDDLEQTRMAATIRNLKRALLIFHSPVDEIVGIENAAKIFQAARHPKSFITLDQADHLLSNASDSRYVGAVIAAWAVKYLNLSNQNQMESNAVDPSVLTRIGRDGFATEINASGHFLMADEPIAVGGTNSGPTPYDYLLAGLGACTAMTLRMYADRKQWPLDSVAVSLRHHKNNSTDCQDCENGSPAVDNIMRQIEINGDLNDRQRRRLLEIANRCPVHRTLLSNIQIDTKIKQ